MFSRVLISFLFIKYVCTQIGDFYWLNEEYTKDPAGQSRTPKYEDTFYLDEHEKNLFRHDSVLTDNAAPQRTNNIYKVNGEENNNDVESHDQKVLNDIPKHFSKDAPIDILLNKFPKDIFVWTYTTKTPNVQTSTHEEFINAKAFINHKLIKNANYEEKLSENICTYMKKLECDKNKGYVNNIILTNLNENIRVKNNALICCILPVNKKNEYDLSRKYFGDSTESNRYKRSEDVAQQQRNVLLKRRYSRPNRKSHRASESEQITTDEVYDDPYWNIRNLYPKKEEAVTKYDTHGEEYYHDDYTAEVPRPGLTSLNSDEKRPNGWTASHHLDDEDVDDTGYVLTTINPRIENGKKRKSRPRKPSKLTTTTEEAFDDAESQTTSYNAYPDYTATQDNFKLLNFLKKSRNKVPKPTRPTRTTTTESFTDNDSQEVSDNGAVESGQEISNHQFDNNQIFKGCGKTIRSIPAAMLKTDKQIAEAENGSHPWLALLVPTRKLNNLLCYASLIHPRVALSAADCVHRSAPREVTIIVGLWNLNERSRLKSRIVNVFKHPKFNGGLSNNLALLYWKRPLKLGANVQPVCLGIPHLDSECIFVGWGGFDQGVHSRSQWQRATIHLCSERLSLNGLGVPPEAFCASVEATKTVTGYGGSLICNVHGHLSAVAVAVSRDSALVLLPALDWIHESITIIQE